MHNTGSGNSNSRWFLSGEVNKWGTVAASKQRFENVEQDYDNDGTVDENTNVGFVNTRDLSSEVRLVKMKQLLLECQARLVLSIELQIIMCLFLLLFLLWFGLLSTFIITHSVLIT